MLVLTLNFSTSLLMAEEVEILRKELRAGKNLVFHQVKSDSTENLCKQLRKFIDEWDEDSLIACLIKDKQYCPSFVLPREVASIPFLTFYDGKLMRLELVGKESIRISKFQGVGFLP